MEVWRRTAVAVLLLFLAALGGCGTGEGTWQEADGGRVKIVCTIFPEYDWTRQLLGGQAEAVDLVLLMEDGSDLHSYQPTVADMRKISDADLFIYIGGESDSWVEDVLSQAKNPDLRALNLMEALEDILKEEEQLEGMQDGHDHEEETEYDEHIWLSLRNAEKACGAIADALAQVDPSHADSYRKNLERYAGQLERLDASYQEMVKRAAHHVLVFGDRFPFRYLAEDYGLRCYAAFSGCSAETEASFETITFLAGKVDELGLPAVLCIDSSDGAVARTIAGNTKSRSQTVLKLDSMQSVKAQDVEAGAEYLLIMEENLTVLCQALES